MQINQITHMVENKCVYKVLIDNSQLNFRTFINIIVQINQISHQVAGYFYFLKLLDYYE